MKREGVAPPFSGLRVSGRGRAAGSPELRRLRVREHFAQLAAVGGKLVWSPQSNLRLYDETTDVGAALAEGVPIALGADWMPSGSPSLLHELKIAWRVIRQQSVPLTPPDLVRMVTSGAADIAGLGDRIGTLAPGMAADRTSHVRGRERPPMRPLYGSPSRRPLSCYRSRDRVTPVQRGESP